MIYGNYTVNAEEVQKKIRFVVIGYVRNILSCVEIML